jgi:hypothetical protein
MNSNMRKALYLAIVTLLIRLTSSQGGFFGSGSDFSIKSDENGILLAGKLLSLNKQSNYASINLDNFIGNLDGKLTWEDNGFAKNCRDCKLNLSKLTCSCQKSDGISSTSSEINLNERISNVDGKFSVFWIFNFSLVDGRGFKSGVKMLIRSKLLNSKGEFISAELDLNQFISNINGYLIWNNSGFTKNCGYCNLKYLVLSCKCQDMKGNFKDSSLNLNGRIGNHDGKFKTFTIKSTEKDANRITESVILQSRQNLNQKVVLSDLTKAFEGKWRGFNAAQNASKAASTINYIKNNRKYKDFKTYDTFINFQNNSERQIKFISSRSHQMEDWNGKFSDIKEGEEKSFYVRTTGQFFMDNYRDTYAEAYFSIECNGKPKSFVVKVRNYVDLTTEWEGSDAYNDCFDILLTGDFNGSVKGSPARASIDDPVLVSGSFTIPNCYTILNLNIIPHQPGTRYPIMFEHCDYQGRSYPILQNEITAETLKGNDFNDRVSSIRVPPGFRVAFFENSDFRGRKIERTGDDRCLRNFNDMTSSYIVNMGPIK